jgi:hypothetical protein
MGHLDPHSDQLALGARCLLSSVIESVIVRMTRWIVVLASGVFECLICEHL